ncbi:hypothetical protein DSM3645_24350 [Blastopirellula marina DSM 3645]|uniref:Uncharacterized protein n=2 Tax=Blastopirellula marina TaxID=124 RepID=A3ZUW1_9BACT|nr:hypothetical protein DSM3645_24350 [Blastopirellula marina DSM 3645]
MLEIVISAPQYPIDLKEGSRMFPAKFCVPQDHEYVEYDYGDLFFEQPCGSATRLVIGPSKGEVDLLTELAALSENQSWYILYVLLTPRQGNRESGRYQSTPFDTLEKLSAFMTSFQSYFEGDARHHVWIGSLSNEVLLIYDQHNVIFAYGPIDRFRAILEKHGFREEEFWFPTPHSHSYAPQYDAEEERLMKEFEWQYFPLQPGDEWE